jgi:protein-disulfide isomerase
VTPPARPPPQVLDSAADTGRLGAAFPAPGHPPHPKDTENEPVANGSPGTPLVVASLILGASIVGSALLLQSSIDDASDDLAKVLVAAQAARPAAAPTPAQAPSRPGRPDPNKRYTISLDGSPVKGKQDASITVVEFSDFQCPFCARVTPTLAKISETYPDDVRIAFKHLPLSMHPKAPAAHAAAEAAHRQGKFWEMHDRIFADQRGMSPARYEQYAQEIGLDLDRYKKDIASAEVKKRVDSDSSEAARLGVSGTPAFFINGRYLSGAQPFESFQRIIEEELERG